MAGMIIPTIHKAMLARYSSIMYTRPMHVLNMSSQWALTNRVISFVMLSSEVKRYVVIRCHVAYYNQKFSDMLAMKLNGADGAKPAS